MSVHFETESGAHYEIRVTPSGFREVRRVNPDHVKRADGEWVRLIGHTVLMEGYAVAIETRSLANYGPDDFGTPPEDAAPTTTRVTTRVTRIWEEVSA